MPCRCMHGGHRVQHLRMLIPGVLPRDDVDCVHSGAVEECLAKAGPVQSAEIGERVERDHAARIAMRTDFPHQKVGSAE